MMTCSVLIRASMSKKERAVLSTRASFRYRPLRLITFIVSLCFILQCPLIPIGHTAPSDNAKLNQLADDIFFALKNRRGLPDLSDAGNSLWKKKLKFFLFELNKFKSSSLRGQENITRRMLIEDLTLEFDFVDKGWIHRDLTSHESLAQTLILEAELAVENRSVETWNKTIALFEKSEQFMNQYIALLQKGVSKGIIQNKTATESTITSLKELLDGSQESNPFLNLLKVFDEHSKTLKQSNQLRKRLEKAVRAQVIPAHENLRTFLVKIYKEKAENVTSSGAMYPHALRIHLGKGHASPEKIHEEGLAAVEALQKLLIKAIKQVDPDASSPKDFFEKFNNAPENTYANEDELKRDARAQTSKALKLAKDHVPIPRFRWKIQNMPKMYEHSVVAWYWPYAKDRSLNIEYGKLEMNMGPLIKSFRRSDMATLMTHEMAGHHVGMGYIAKNVGKLPHFRNHLYKSITDEGLAVYTEYIRYQKNQLDARETIGYLVYRLFLAARLVVDTGLHTNQMSRDEAIHYFQQATFEPKTSAEAEIDRYIEWPGQALSYHLGFSRIVKLKKEVKEILGPKHYDEKTFNRNMFSLGPVPIEERENASKKAARRRLAQRQPSKNVKAQRNRGRTHIRR